jgi:hypothetical protein
MTRFLILLGMFFGSMLGGYLPVLWGDSAFSMTSVLTSTIGGLFGIWVGYHLARKI